MLDEKNQVLTKVYNRRGIDAAAVVAEYLGYGERLRPYVADTGPRAEPGARRRPDGAARGRPGDACSTWTTAPTRSSPRSSPPRAAPARGSGIGPTRITEVIGIVKAYTTRVGSRAVPHRAARRAAARLPAQGRRRVRRDHRAGRAATGWFDAVIARYATRVNGITDYFITKLDVLSGLEKVPVCVAYDVAGTRHDEIPMTQTEFHHATPVYGVPRRLVGGPVRGAEFAGPPRNAQAYVRRRWRRSSGRRWPRSAPARAATRTLQLRPLV